MMKCAVLVLLLSVVISACSGSGSDADVVDGVQASALAAAAGQTSYVIDANGSMTQGDTTADITLSYTKDAGGRLQYAGTSTVGGEVAKVGLISVPPNAWSLEDGRYVPFTMTDLSTFEGRRMWSLVPFGGAERVGDEDIAGRPATHYRTKIKASLPLPELVGSLVASDDVELRGEFREAEVDYWVDAEKGWPLQVSYKATGDGTFTLTAQLTRVNDETIVVSAPRE